MTHHQPVLTAASLRLVQNAFAPRFLALATCDFPRVAPIALRLALKQDHLLVLCGLSLLMTIMHRFLRIMLQWQIACCGHRLFAYLIDLIEMLLLVHVCHASPGLFGTLRLRLACDQAMDSTCSPFSTGTLRMPADQAGLSGTKSCHQIDHWA